MKKIGKWVKISCVTILMRISFALKNVEEELRANASDLLNGIRKEFKKRSSNPLLKKMEQGTTDERYVQQYYEVLKKADEFVRSSNPDKVAKAADKHGVNLGAKDKWGVRWDHHGFLDPKHKHYGKTLKQIRDLEMEERKHDEDSYPVIAMFYNKVELSFVQATKVLKSENDSFFIPELSEMAKMQKFPLTIIRKNNTAINRIEQLTEFVHVKAITSTEFILEFFIPMKYGLINYGVESSIFKELTDIEQVWFSDEYGDKHLYKVSSFYKRSPYQEYVNEKMEKKFRYEIIKFRASLIVELK